MRETEVGFFGMLILNLGKSGNLEQCKREEGPEKMCRQCLPITDQGQTTSIN